MVRGWGPRPVKGRATGPPIRLGRPHPGGDPEVDTTRTSTPAPLKALDRPPAPPPAPHASAERAEAETRGDSP